MNVEENYTIIEDQLFMKNPDDWGGAYVDGNVLVVLTVTYSVEEADRILADLGIHAGVEVRATDVSMADLDGAVAAIVESPSRPDSVVVVGPQYSRSAVVLGVTDGGSENLDSLVDLPAVAGMDVITYDTSEGNETSRYYDSSPFYGGDLTFFRSGSGSAQGCSSGFSWTMPSGGYRMVSAAHCYNSGTGEYFGTTARLLSNGTVAATGTVFWTSGGASGTTSGRHGDLSVWTLSSGSAAARVFTGTYNTTTTRTIIGRVSLPENWHGTTLRTSGAAGYWGNGDGEINPDWISLVNQTVTYSNGQTYTSLTVAEHVSDCTGQGDSGGAFYIQSGTGTAKAVGIISGDNGQGWGLTNCRNYYTPLSYLVADYGGDVRVP